MHLYRTNLTNFDRVQDFSRPDVSKDLLLSTSYEFENVASGQGMGFYYLLVDHYGMVVKTDDHSLARFKNSAGATSIYFE